MTVRAIAAAAVAAAALAGAGCGDDDEGGGGGGGAATTVEVSATDFKFDPADPTVDKAGKVEFKVTNDGKATHALEVETPDGEFETDPIAPGESATLTADLKAGTFKMYCPIGDHEQRGMKGSVVVGKGGGGSGDGEDKDSGGGGSPGGY
jgi:plastocyanin